VAAREAAARAIEQANLEAQSAREARAPVNRLLQEALPFLNANGFASPHALNADGHSAIHVAIEALRLGHPVLNATLALVQLADVELINRLCFQMLL
jgi:hypothetical protein